MLVIGCSQNSGFTMVEATNILLSNDRGSTNTLAVAEPYLPMDFLACVLGCGWCCTGFPPTRCYQYSQPTRDVTAISMQSRVGIYLQPVSSTGHPELSGADWMGPNFQNTDTQAPPRYDGALHAWCAPTSTPFKGKFLLFDTTIASQTCDRYP